MDLCCQAALHGRGAWGALVFQPRSRREEENKLLCSCRAPMAQHPRAPRPTCPSLQEPAGAREPCLPFGPASPPAPAAATLPRWQQTVPSLSAAEPSPPGAGGHGAVPRGDPAVTRDAGPAAGAELAGMRPQPHGSACAATYVARVEEPAGRSGSAPPPNSSAPRISWRNFKLPRSRPLCVLV